MAPFVPGRFAAALALCLALCLAPAAGAAPAPDPQRGLDAQQLAIVINDEDPDSLAIGEVYRKRRGIPAANVVHVRIPGRPQALDPGRFEELRQEIDGRLAPGIQVVLMIWTAPYKVGCQGITAAYTLGFDAALCAHPCGPGRPSRYFNARGGRPYGDYGVRLSMLLPVVSQAQAKALIARGIDSHAASGRRRTAAHAWYLTTSEAARNSRTTFFPMAGYLPAYGLTVHRLRADVLDGASNVLVYQTGRAQVDKLETVRFLPGALADHLTSHGGELLGSSQMSSLRWLEAGATASYGTVGEPCNHWQKFPNPAVLLRHYLNGDSAIEAYWKSVAWPGQGVFIGEPLAAPFRSQPRTVVR